VGSIEREIESSELEAELCLMVKENRFLLGMKPAVKNVLQRVATFNNWQILIGELKK
jgi:hypothetical protein